MFELCEILVSDFLFYSQILFAAVKGGENQNAYARIRTQTHAGQTASKKKKKAECLLWFAEPGGLQAQHWRSVMQTEQNATSTEAPANSLFSHDMFRPRLL